MKHRPDTLPTPCPHCVFCGSDTVSTLWGHTKTKTYTKTNTQTGERRISPLAKMTEAPVPGSKAEKALEGEDRNSLCAFLAEDRGICGQAGAA